MDLSLNQIYTTDEIYQLPDGERAELIDGHIYYMAPPSGTHQRILLELAVMISKYIQSQKGTCKVYPAPYAVFLNNNDTTYVEPDISVICDRSKITEKGCMGAPDWVIEIVSPSSKKMDYMIKLIKYKHAGVREYWIVDEQKDRVMVYDFEHDDMNEYTFSDRVKAAIYEGLEIDFEKLRQLI